MWHVTGHWKSNTILNGPLQKQKKTHMVKTRKRKAKQGSIIEYSKTNKFKFLIKPSLIDSKLNIKKKPTDNGKEVVGHSIIHNI